MFTPNRFLGVACTSIRREHCCIFSRSLKSCSCVRDEARNRTRTRKQLKVKCKCTRVQVGVCVSDARIRCTNIIVYKQTGLCEEEMISITLGNYHDKFAQSALSYSIWHNQRILTSKYIISTLQHFKRDSKLSLNLDIVPYDIMLCITMQTKMYYPSQITDLYFYNYIFVNYALQRLNLIIMQ